MTRIIPSRRAVRTSRRSGSFWRHQPSFARTATRSICIFGNKTTACANEGVYLEIVRWENSLDAMSSTRLQDEYNQAIRRLRRVRQPVQDEDGQIHGGRIRRRLYQTFQETGKPLIYTYFRKAAVSTSASNRGDLISLWDFQKKLGELGHFHTEYESIDGLQKHFRDQLDRLRAEDLV